ncbi:E3 ubiquitin-protein ligase airp2 [Castilleja foliolosa]|uniref:E3 ubiquitin-protein ligase airp2 n=1 Tax=Castilleja foliolosa TaxID=1961234 RepID=A0ABD3DJJ4_9LAMI
MTGRIETRFNVDEIQKNRGSDSARSRRRFSVYEIEAANRGGDSALTRSRWASDFSREYDGAWLQMRMSYSPAAHFFLFLVQWTDCNLAGALGLLRILIYKVYVDGTTTMSTHERKASIREFYAVIYPSLMQLERGVTDSEDKKQKAVCLERYRRKDEEEQRLCSELEIEREDECGICMEMNSKIVLPNCNHVMCQKCYRECRPKGVWRTWGGYRDLKGVCGLVADGSLVGGKRA